MSHVGHTRRGHVGHTRRGYVTCESVMSRVDEILPANESWHTGESVMSQVNESCHT